MEISVSEAKAILTDLVRRAEQGEHVVLTRHGAAVATIRPVRAIQSKAERRKSLEKFLGSASTTVRRGTTAASAQNELYDDDGLPK